MLAQITIYGYEHHLDSVFDVVTGLCKHKMTIYHGGAEAEFYCRHMELERCLREVCTGVRD